MHRESESADKPVFCLNSAYHTNYSYWMCNIIFAQRCVTLYKYEHRFLWLQVKTYYYNHLTASAKPVHYVPTDKINLSIRIRQMLTSFVTSLINILLTYLLWNSLIVSVGVAAAAVESAWLHLHHFENIRTDRFLAGNFVSLRRLKSGEFWQLGRMASHHQQNVCDDKEAASCSHRQQRSVTLESRWLVVGHKLL